MTGKFAEMSIGDELINSAPLQAVVFMTFICNINGINDDLSFFI